MVEAKIKIKVPLNNPGPDTKRLSTSRVTTGVFKCRAMAKENFSEVTREEQSAYSITLCPPVATPFHRGTGHGDVGLCAQLRTLMLTALTLSTLGAVTWRVLS